MRGQQHARRTSLWGEMSIRLTGRLISSMLDDRFRRALRRRARRAFLACFGSLAGLCTTKVDLWPLAGDFCDQKTASGTGLGKRVNIKVTNKRGGTAKLTHSSTCLASRSDAVTARLAIAAGKAGQRDAWPLDGSASGHSVGLGGRTDVRWWCIVVNIVWYV